MPRPPVIAPDQLASESATLLPGRETLSCQYGCVNVSTVVGVNVALAINAASVNSTAHAFATQYLTGIQ
jgi:hypothetical protein